ncbi:MAG: hypothetical protein HY922_11975 [Elusimicrobia bacterium]|nr:hypothetical protein [Elusimicrobiota bacterium]
MLDLSILESGIMFLIAGLTMAEPARDELKVSYQGPSQIEVGGPFVGIEMHEGSPLLNRLNFYYPIANSVDSSTGYWQRGGSRVMSLGLKIGDGPKTWMDSEPFKYEYTPYWASFRRSDGEKTIRVAYEFCKNKPAMTVTIELTNDSPAAKGFELYSHLEASIKTSHTAALKDRAWTEYDQAGSSIYVNYESSETGDFQMFAANAAQQPAGFMADSAAAGFPGAGENWWMNKAGDLPGTVISRTEPRRPLIAYAYKKNLAPKETMTVAQIIGSARLGEGRELVKHLLGSYQSETRLYERFVLEKALREGSIETGDEYLDRSARWAKAVLAVNRHYLDRDMVPMPCPAEYNFFFTHDALVTDLAAANFDPGRVKKDLEYIAGHAGADNAIAHAYYWKDGRYVTEFAGADNWNHFWFVLVSGAYLRHSGDAETVRKLYPYLAKSIRLMLSNNKDHLIWAYRPDWWDFGNSFGPRSYMTILAIRSLREFAYISTALGMDPSESAGHEGEALKLQEQLNARLWDKRLNYFINYYGDGKKDEHLYIGSLLAAHFNLADPDKKAALIKTAQEKLLEARTGIYNAVPMDFQKLEGYLKFNGPEEGDPFYYMNGGIWAHGNAWYSLALVSANKRDEAFRFVKDVMTIDGIRLGPNGQYAMYECRNGNRRSPEDYGKVDKPQFLWAAGWYLYALYDLLGVRENEWNISLDPWLAGTMARSRYSLHVRGRPVLVETGGTGKYIKSIKYDGVRYPSAVVPEKVRLNEKIEITLGIPGMPYVASAGSILKDVRYDASAGSLVVELKAFKGHKSAVAIISPLKPVSMSLNAGELKTWSWRKDSGVYRIDASIEHSAEEDAVTVRF